MRILITSLRVTDQDPALQFYKTFDELVAKGIEVIQEPMERFYGIDAAFRDDSGNHIRMTQVVETGVAGPEGWSGELPA